MLEALGRAQLNTGRYAAAARTVSGRSWRQARVTITHISGSASRWPVTGTRAAAEPSISRWRPRCAPTCRHYTDALRGVRATLRARAARASA